MSHPVSPDLLQHLACPRDHLSLHDELEYLRCDAGHKYPVIDGVPVFLMPEKGETIGLAADSYRAAATKAGGPLYLDTLGLGDVEKSGVAARWGKGDTIDPAISFLVAATSGYGYLSLIGKMQQYPVSNIPVPNEGGLLLDVGCSWGRWTISAARKGWRAIGIDPSLGAIMAAKRAFDREGLPMWFVCGDARAMPFKTGIFDCVFSYSVLQHFSEEDAQTAFAEMGRVLQDGGFAKVQMAQKWGLRSTYVRTRPTYMTSGGFRVRYWSFPELRAAFERSIGPCRIDAEAYGGLGLLAEDFQVVTGKAKLLITASIVARAISKVLRPLAWLADSVYVTAHRRAR